MGYDLYPRNEDCESFHCGAFSWDRYVRPAEYLFPIKFNGDGTFSYLTNQTRNWQEIMFNDGFEITAEEARLWAQCVRNYCALNDGDDWKDRFLKFAEFAENSGGFTIC